MTTSVDQVTRRRIMRTGLTAYEPGRACPGYVLYSPNGAGDSLYLLDMEGREVHRWQVPFAPRYGYLLPNGNLFVLLRSGGETGPMWPSWPTHQTGLMVEMDWDGKVVWEHRDPYQHHDARRTTTGGAIYLTVDRVPEAIAQRVKGGALSRKPGPMWGDILVEVDAAGRRVWEWRSWEYLDPETAVLEQGNHGEEWTHGNTIMPLDGDRVLVSFRNISMVAIIGKASGKIAWSLGDEVLAQQHDANLLANGNVLIFDNGANRKHLGPGFSRVIEVDPASSTIVWEYRDNPATSFYSPNISGARRLINGNTLITEGRFGRMFQVTPDGEVVWEYINPHFHQMSSDGATHNAVFRATHYTPVDLEGRLPR